jgi:ureidoglycolate lyase/seryl-tRNA synthetase
MTIGVNRRLDSTSLRIVRVPILPVTSGAFADYGRIVENYARAAVDIVTWPAPGRRPIDPGTGRGGGITEGPFEMQWRGDVLYAQNHAVGGFYVTGWTRNPAEASEEQPTVPRTSVLTGEANYHPDGGQIFFPRGREPFVALLARPGDEVRPEDFVAFHCPGDFGIHLGAGVWHQPVFPLGDRVTFDDKQSAVHACVSVDFVGEFGCLLQVPLVP